MRSSISALGILQALHAKRDVLGDGHVREERIMLKDRVHRPLVGRQVLDLVTIEKNRAGGHVLEARDHAQERGLAAAARSEQREKLVVPDIERGGFDRREGAVAFHHVTNLDSRLVGLP